MIVAVLQARMGSSRLPGKVLMPILGEPMLARQIERLQRCKCLDRLVVATTSQRQDDAIAELCERVEVPSFRGDINDVLDRLYHAALRFEPTAVVRLTGDCPLTDPNIIDRLVEFYGSNRFDYASNTLRPTWPDGLDAEICSFTALSRAWVEAALPPEREHVTPFIYNRPDEFRLGSLENERDISGLRWTVDEAVDFAFVTAVYEALYPGNPAFDTAAILALLDERPDLAAINAGIGRNEGLARSLCVDGAAPAGKH